MRTLMVLLILMFSTAAWAYHPVEFNHESRGAIRIDTLTVQDGPVDLNRFQVTHVHHLTANRHRPVVMPPGGGSSWRVYDLADSLVEYLATAGYDLWLYTPRSLLVPPGYCAQNDCSAMRTWGMNSYARDIDYIANLATFFNGRRPALYGWSLGAMLGLASVNAHPQKYRGLFIEEVGFYYDDPVLAAAMAPSCAALTTQAATGVPYDDQMYPTSGYVLSLGVNDPISPSPLIPGLTNQQAMFYLFTAVVTIPANEVPNERQLNGDVTGFRYADLNKVRQLGVQFTYYDPIALQRDYRCALAGTRTFTGNLGAFSGRVFSMQAGLGWGAYAEPTLRLLVNAQIERLVEPDFGHGDYSAHSEVVSKHHLPIKNWLDSLDW